MGYRYLASWARERGRRSNVQPKKLCERPGEASYRQQLVGGCCHRGQKHCIDLADQSDTAHCRI